MEHISTENDTISPVSVVVENAFDPVGFEMRAAMPGSLVLQVAPGEEMHIPVPAQAELKEDKQEDPEHKAYIEKCFESDQLSTDALVRIKVRNELIVQLYSRDATKAEPLDTVSVQDVVREVYLAERERHFEQFHHVLDTAIPFAETRHEMSSIPGLYRDKDLPDLLSRCEIDTMAITWLDEMIDGDDESALKQKTTEMIKSMLLDTYQEVLGIQQEQIESYHKDQETIRDLKVKVALLSEEIAALKAAADKEKDNSEKESSMHLARGVLHLVQDAA